MKKAIGWVIALGGVGALLWGLSKKKAAPVSSPATPTSDSIAEALQTKIDQAKAAADTLRGAVGGNPLAASILGVDPSLLSGSASPDNAAQIKDLQAQLIAKQNELANDQSNYKVNHNGGQSPSQEAGIEGPIINAINDLQAQLAKLSIS